MSYIVNTGIKIITNVLNSLTVHVSSFFTLGLSLMYVVVNFLSQVIFVFILFLVMVRYANEDETKEKEKLPEIKKNNYNIIIFVPNGEIPHCSLTG